MVVPLLFWARTSLGSIKEGSLIVIVKNQLASTAVNITGEASENVCVAIRDCSAAKCLLQTEVQVSKQHKHTDILYPRLLPRSGTL